MRRSPLVLMRILFFGGDEVSLAVLRALFTRIGTQLSANPEAQPPDELEVVCPPIANNQRGAVLQFCQKNALKHHIVPNPKSLSKPIIQNGEKLQCFQLPHLADPPISLPFDVAVVASFRYFIPPSVQLGLPRHVVNVHPSLLPKYRGASPIHATLLHGDDVGGVTLMKIVPGEPTDCGDMLMQRQISIPKDMDYRQYFPLVNQLAADAVIEALYGGPAAPSPRVDLGFLGKLWDSATVQPNKAEKLSMDVWHAPLLKSTSGRIIWETMCAEEATNVWRAFVGEYRVFSYFSKKATPIASQLRKQNKLRALRCVFREVAGGHYGSPALREELSRLQGSELAPGTLYFPRSDDSVGAVCCRGNVPQPEGQVVTSDLPAPVVSCSWFLWRSITLEDSVAPLTPRLMSLGMKMQPGVLFPNVFRSSP